MTGERPIVTRFLILQQNHNKNRTLFTFHGFFRSLKRDSLHRVILNFPVVGIHRCFVAPKIFLRERDPGWTSKYVRLSIRVGPILKNLSHGGRLIVAYLILAWSKQGLSLVESQLCLN